MKKICSIFMTALILCFCVININPVSAETVGEPCSQTNSIYLNKEIDKNDSNQNIEYTKLNNSEGDKIIADQINVEDKVIEVFNHDSKQLYITKDDIDLMAKLVSAESIGEPYTGKIAVASVVLNRATNPNFPNTIKEVIFQKNVFSCVKNKQIKASATQECYDAVYEAIKGADPTNEALFFYNPSTATCPWMKQTQKVNQTTIGNHTFFKIKS